MDISLYGVFTCTYILGNLLLPLDKSDCRCIIVLPFKNKSHIKDRACQVKRVNYFLKFIGKVLNDLGIRLIIDLIFDSNLKVDVATS